jgi:ABC-2 type transport system permease protein
MTGEYATGMVRASLLAVPGRWVFVIAKAIVVGGLGALVGEVCALISFLAVQHALRPTGRAVQLDDPHVLRAVVAAGLYLAVVALVGLGVGAAVRHTGPAVVTLVAVVFLAWPAARAVEGISTLPSRLLLANAVDALVTVVPLTGPQAARVPGVSLAWGVLAAYAVVALGAAGWRAGRDT